MISCQRHNQRLFAFLGAETAPGKDGVALLPQMVRDGYTLLALDIQAMAKASEAGAPYTTIDDWLEEDELAQVRKVAEQCVQNWFLPAREMFTVDEVCWPEIDSIHIMRFFWRDVTIALALAEQFRRHRVKELRFLQNAVKNASLRFDTYDAYTSLWESELPEMANPQQNSSSSQKQSFLQEQLSFGRQVLGNASRKITRVLRPGKQNDSVPMLTSSPNDLAGKIVLLCSYFELYRFLPFLEQLRQYFPGEVALVLSWAKPSTANHIAAERSLPVICPVVSQSPSLDLQQRFLNAYAQAQNTAHERDPWYKPLRCLDFHFTFYCAKRWPKMVTLLDFWAKLWAQARPKAIIGSSSHFLELEPFLAVEAAQRVGIPLISVPHSGVTAVKEVLFRQLRSSVLYNTPLQRKIFEAYGVSAQNLIACRNITPQNAYPETSSSTKTLHQNKWSLLALTNTTLHSLCPTVAPKSQIRALRILDSFPEDIAASLVLSVKVHPRFSELALFSMVSQRLAECVLPVQTALDAILREVELVVFVNGFGTSIFHVLRAGKPVIFLQTADLSFLRYISLFQSAGVVVNSQDEFWTVVRDFFTKPEVAEEMRKKALSFCHNNLSEEMFPDIRDVLPAILDKQA